MKEIQGKSILVRVSEGSSYRESTVSQTRAVGVDVNSDPENDLYHFAWLKKYYQILRTVPVVWFQNTPCVILPQPSQFHYDVRPFCSVFSEATTRYKII